MLWIHLVREGWIGCVAACALVYPMGTDTLNVVHDPFSLNPWIPWFEMAANVCRVRHCGVVGSAVDLRECSVALVVGRAESWREIIETRHLVPFYPTRLSLIHI